MNVFRLHRKLSLFHSLSAGLGLKKFITVLLISIKVTLCTFNFVSKVRG